jgi:hypothetical protein
MLAESYYVIQSRRNGKHLAAHPQGRSPSAPHSSQEQDAGFLLLFREKPDALSYLNTHAGELTPQFQVEPIQRSQLPGLIKRWQFRGVGLVNDPLVPQIEFLIHENS